jgi:hypothetical protein
MSLMDKIKSFFSGGGDHADHDHSGHDHSHEPAAPVADPVAPPVAEPAEPESEDKPGY